MWISQKTKTEAFELDELFWFTNGRKEHEHGINTYIMTMMSRIPRQLVGFAVDKSVNSIAIQSIVDSVPSANNYYTDGNSVYCDVIFGGRHRRNINDKKDTHLIESTNADLRHYIAGLKRRSKCFFRSIDSLTAVLNVFCSAYNKFGEAKMLYRQQYPEVNQMPFSALDYL